MEIENNPLLRNLVSDAEKEKHHLATGRVDFGTAMVQMGIRSVFDIIRQSKATFCQQLSKLNDDDGAAAYDNAMCYAVQIGRAYREHVISSGKKPGAVQQSGIRSLVDVGPSYANLFKENWADFCKVGAMEAVDSPVAYLNRLYQLAINEIEQQGDGVNARILLDMRRPDLKDLLINHQNTYSPVPVLDIVNDVLTKAIENHHASPSGPSVHELMRAKRHPFIFPYHFAHHQAMLGLSGQQHMMLGETNYQISRQLPVQQNGDNEFGRVEHPAVEAQRLLSGLSPEQQEVLIEPTLFSDFYIERAELDVPVEDGVKNVSPSNHLPWLDSRYIGFVIPEQDTIGAVENGVDLTILTVDNSLGALGVNMAFKDEGDNLSGNITLNQHSYAAHNVNWERSYEGVHSKHFIATYQPEKNEGILLPEETNLGADFHVVCSSHYAIDTARHPQKDFLSQRYTISLNRYGYQLTEEQKAFFQRNYNMTVITPGSNGLVHLGTFMAKTGTRAEDVEALLAQKQHAPVLSANCQVINALAERAEFPSPTHYGAGYVNGVGGRDAGSIGFNDLNNSMGLIEESIGDVKVWRLTQTSLNRFDRMQRMIRLQRWMGISYAELDTLIMSAIRSERESNLGYDLNVNTVRTLGVYRYLSERYSITPEEFAGLVHYISPFASGERTPLFDQVFNSPALFDTPLILDQSVFDITATDAATQKTIAQLCAGLNLQPTETSFFRLANDTKDLANNGHLSRDLGTVSSLYRQARIAQLFDLSVEDSWNLIDLLGGEAYRERIASGSLRPVSLPDAQATEEIPDILDILMHMDWAVTWLKESNQNVSALRRHLGVDQDDSGLVAKLESAVRNSHGEVQQALQSVQNLTPLYLPVSDATGTPIDWIGGVLQACMNSNGAVNDLPMTALDSLGSWLSGNIAAELRALTFENDPITDAAFKDRLIQRLVEHLMKGHATQHRIIHELLRSGAGVQADRVDAAIRWSGHQVPQLLTAMASTSETAQSVAILIATVRHAEVMHTLALGVPALTAFMANPDWLDHQPGPTTDLTLANLYLLERYCQWAQTTTKTEDDILAYFELANAEQAPPSDIDHPNRCAAALAALIGWSSAEVLVATTTLEGQVAKSMQQVDWVRRIHSASQQSRLSAAALLLTTQLDSEVEPAKLKNGSTPDSGVDHWNAVGQALMAARR